MTETTKTLCPYCGVGCGLEVQPPALPGRATHRDSQGNPIWRVRGDRDHPSSQGKVCVKGATIAESLDRDRLKYPMLRDRLDDPFRRVSWEVALDRVAEKIQAARDRHGPDSICMYGSGQLQTEDYYTAQKLLKGCLGTNNFDANSRLCMSSAVAGYIQSFGADGPPCCYDDLEATDCAFIIGANMAECHPIAFNRFIKHHKRKRRVKLIVVDPRKTPTAEPADLHLAIRPGTDLVLLHGIAHLLLKWGTLNTYFIEEHTRGFATYTQLLQKYPPEKVARRCGIPLADLYKAAKFWGRSQRVLSLWSMGVNQSSEGTAKVRTIINLHLMTGTIGKPGSGPFSLTGQPNAMGGREAGGLAHILPGYRLVKNPEHRAAVEAAWQVPAGSISPEPGRDAWSMITGLEDQSVKVLWIAATNPAVSMPDIKRTQAALRRSPFTVYQEAYYPTETAAYAHVLLPAAQWGEKTGVMTNSERVVTLCPAFRSQPGEARADWEIMAAIGQCLGFEAQFAWQNAAEVYDEFVALTAGRPCDMSALSHDRLHTDGPAQWPCPQGTPQLHQHGQRLYTDGQFHTPDGRAIFAAIDSGGLAEPADADYPFVLTVGRLYGHWHTQTRTGRIEKITKMHPEPFIEIHLRDAERLGVSEGDWLMVRSRRGQAQFKVQVTSKITPGLVFVPMHWGSLWAENAEANALTHPEACPSSLQPELKACAVQLTKVAPGQMEQTRLDQTPTEMLVSAET
ncbi:MAG: molybdopterin oxidoreductase family protein [Spirulinaceae cyanobacterium]